jgi:hypothetical protein
LLIPLALLACLPEEAPAPVEPLAVGGKVLHRLNHVEYDNTVRDLLQTSLRPSSGLPPDEVVGGLDNNARALTLSATHLGVLEVAADAMLDEMMGRIVEETLTGPLVGPNAPGTVFSGEGDLFADRYCLTSGELSVTHPARYGGLFEVSVAAFTPDDVERSLALFVDGERIGSTALNGTYAEPAWITLTAPLTGGLHRVTWQLEGSESGAVCLMEQQLVGPTDPTTGTTAAYDDFFTCSPDDGERACAEEVLGNFGRRAFRRPVSDEQLGWLMGLYDGALAEASPWDEAVQYGMKGALLHPAFLYRIELDPPEGTAARRLDGYELASRLSYFLWSTMPDEALLQAAEAGALEDSAGLLDQTQRMVSDAQSQALAKNLGGQWFNVRKLDDIEPNPEVYPAYDAELRASMEHQLTYLAEDFFAGRVNLEQLLLDQESWVDARLAAHYGLTWPEGDDGFVKMPLPDGQLGLMGTAGWLATNSNPTHPNAVRRGKWVLQNLLCDVPPPPPPDVEGMAPAEPDPADGSVREQEEALRAEMYCQNCHREMDPIGFAMGSFDGLGVLRTEDELGFPIDTVSAIDGAPVSSLEEVARYVLDDARMPRCIVDKTFTYALGRAPSERDEQDLQVVTDRFVASGMNFQGLVQALVTSRAFQYRSVAVEAE